LRLSVLAGRLPEVIFLRDGQRPVWIVDAKRQRISHDLIPVSSPLAWRRFHR
jgi:hypothetical protein